MRDWAGSEDIARKGVAASPLGNQLVYMLKMSSLVSVIGMSELTRRANELVVTESVYFTDAEEPGDPDWTIAQSPFMRDNARTVSFEQHLVLAGDALAVILETDLPQREDQHA